MSRLQIDPKRSRLPRLAIAAGLVAVVCLVLGYRALSLPESPAAGEPVTARPPATASPAHPGASAGSPVEPGQPALLRLDYMGLRIDAARLFEIGFAGGLVIDADTLGKLEGLLASLPEDPSQETMDQLEYTLRNGLPRADADKAIRLVHGYRSYLADSQQAFMAAGIPQTQADADVLLQHMADAQRRHFDPDVADALFGEQNRYAKLVLEAGFVESDPRLGEAEKRARLVELRNQLPAHMQGAIALPEASPSGASDPAP